MEISVTPLTENLIPFVHDAFEQNIEILHGSPISEDAWYLYLLGEKADPYEVNFIILADQKPAAWLKINGLNSDSICISMLVVDDAYKRCGIGSFALKYTEEYALNQGKKQIRIQTTTDNVAAAQCYLKCGYKIIKEMKYTVGDGILRDGYEFIKDLHCFSLC